MRAVYRRFLSVNFLSSETCIWARVGDSFMQAEAVRLDVVVCWYARRDNILYVLLFPHVRFLTLSAFRTSLG